MVFEGEYILRTLAHRHGIAGSSSRRSADRAQIFPLHGSTASHVHERRRLLGRSITAAHEWQLGSPAIRCNGGSNQFWTFSKLARDSQGRDIVVIHFNMNESYCLDLPGGNTATHTA